MQKMIAKSRKFKNAGNGLKTNTEHQTVHSRQLGRFRARPLSLINRIASFKTGFMHMRTSRSPYLMLPLQTELHLTCFNGKVV